MRKISPLFLLLILTLLISSTAYSQELVQAIDVVGNQRVDESTVLLQVSSKTNQVLDPKQLETDIKEIFKSGFFEQVTAKLESQNGLRTLVFQVVEKPAIRNVMLQGNDEVDDESLKEKLNIPARRFLDRKKIQAGITEAKTLYQAKGLFGTEIDYQVSPVPDNQVDLTFIIKEGDKKKLREIVFEGNKEMDRDDLLDAIKTGEYSWWSSWISGSGVVKTDNLKNDVREVSKLYLTRGYADAKVGEPVVEETAEGLKVIFKIEEGPIYSFGRISVAGDMLDAGEEVTKEGVESMEGETFNVEKLRKDTFTISEKFTDIGYAFANVEPVSDIDRANRKVDIRFDVDKGALVTVDKINITGNSKTQDNVVRRSLKVNERELYSSSKVKKSQELLGRLGYFDEVSIVPEASRDKDKVDLNVAVREGNTGTFSIGAGLSSGDGFIANTRVSENNILGTGNALTLNVDYGSKNENYVASFDNPRLFDSLWSVGVDLSSVEKEFDDFDRQIRGGALSFGHPIEFLGEDFADDLRFVLKYELLDIDISNVESDAPFLVKEQAGKTTSSSITPRLLRNTIDNPLNPTKGSRQSTSFEAAGLGGDEEFWFSDNTNTWYYPFLDTAVGPLVFSHRLRFAWGETYGGDDDFPLFRRLFPGGINSVRGFGSRKLGPRDENGNRFGGNKELVTNFDFIFPLLSQIGLKGVIFFDAGEAFNDGESMSLNDLRLAYGYGLRWSSPLGPIRIEIGYPLDKETGESSAQTQFSFGSPL